MAAFYKIKHGDTLSEIAQRNGTTVEEIMKSNPSIKDANWITADSTINLPTGGNSSSSGPKETTQKFEYDPFEYASYKEGDSVKDTLGKKTAADSAVASYGDFAYGNQQMYDDVIKKIMGREKFSYDLNGDALYQQYKDKYIKQGKMAMADTMGQAVAMTGGYGNSYAATVGNQAYQAHLENLNDIVPELYQMAYDKYNQEGQDLYNKYSMLAKDRATQYGEWTDGYNRLVADRGYYSDAYDNERSFDYNKYADGRDFAWNQYTDNKKYAYQDHRDAVEDEQWNKTFNEGIRQFNESLALQKKNDVISDEGQEEEAQGTPQYKAVDNKKVTNFQSGIRTRNEFYGRSSPEKERYGTYEKYIEGMLDEWVDPMGGGKLTDDEKATLLKYYNLA